MTPPQQERTLMSERTVEHIDQLLAMKTRLTTIKGYAQLLEREIERSNPRPERLENRIAELNSEIERLVVLIDKMEQAMIVPDGSGEHDYVDRRL